MNAPMNRFLERVQRRIIQEREDRMASASGRGLPGPDRGNPGGSVCAIRDETILRLTASHPSWTTGEIAAEAECNIQTVRKTQRRAGVYREPAWDPTERKWVMP